MRGRSAVLLIFVLSGAAGLIYEVVWARQLVLVFGNTTQAISAILTGFFGGMAVGSYFGGRLADRVRRPLRLYGFLELALVVVVLATPLLFRGIHEVYRGAYTSLETAPTELSLVRFALALAALAPATVLMGATLPTLSRYLARRRDELSTQFGSLYAANTLGAIVGTIVSGFVLIELLGLTGTLRVGAACSAAAGLGALALEAWSRRSGAQEGIEAAPAAATGEASPPSRRIGFRERASAVAGASADAGAAAFSPAYEADGEDWDGDVAVERDTGRSLLPGFAWPRPRFRPLEPSAGVARLESAPAASNAGLAIAVAFVSGLTSLGYQVLWTRLLSSGTGNTTYIFTTILTIFLVGIAGGAVLFTKGIGRGAGRIGSLGITQLAISAIALFGIALISDRLILLPLSSKILYVVLPATLIMGLALPIASGLAARGDETVGGDTGRLLAANTAGTVVGTFIVPFFLIPLIGSPRSVVVLALCNALLGTALILRARRAPAGVDTRTWRPMPRPVRWSAVGFGGLLAVLAVLGIVVQSNLIVDPGQARVLRFGTLYASAEDEIASVQAGALGTQKHLWVAGTSMTALTVDAKLMPLLPLMARPQSQRLLAIAFGMGSSYRMGLTAGLTVDGVELVPSVPKMLGYYASDAAQVLADPRGQLFITDGRNHVELTDRTYDIVVVDPPPPIQSSGTSVLYSREFYQAASSRLTPGGVMMEWMPYNQNIDEFRAHVRTFNSVFPQVTIAFGPGGYGVFMLGSTQPIELTSARALPILQRPGVMAELENTPDNGGRSLADWVRQIPSLVWISGRQVARFGGTGPLITDDQPRTEYFLLRSIYGPHYPFMTRENLIAATPSGPP